MLEHTSELEYTKSMLLSKHDHACTHSTVHETKSVKFVEVVVLKLAIKFELHKRDNYDTLINWSVFSADNNATTCLSITRLERVAIPSVK